MLRSLLLAAWTATLANAGMRFVDGPGELRGVNADVCCSVSLGTSRVQENHSRFQGEELDVMYVDESFCQGAAIDRYRGAAVYVIDVYNSCNCDHVANRWGCAEEALRLAERNGVHALVRAVDAASERYMDPGKGYRIIASGVVDYGVVGKATAYIDCQSTCACTLL